VDDTGNFTDGPDRAHRWHRLISEPEGLAGQAVVAQQVHRGPVEHRRVGSDALMTSRGASWRAAPGATPPAYRLCATGSPDLATNLAAARERVYHAIWRYHDLGSVWKCSMAKLCATELATDEATTSAT
jgi:hypothetical protein